MLKEQWVSPNGQYHMQLIKKWSRRVLGLLCMLTGIFFLVMKISTVPDAMDQFSVWAESDRENWCFIGFTTLDLATQAARIFIGYFILSNKKLTALPFYSLLFLMATGGMSGILLATACYVVRVKGGWNYD